MQHSIFQAALLCAGLALAGCSVSIPLPSLLSDDDDFTASIDKSRVRPAASRILPTKAVAPAPALPEVDAADPVAAKAPT